ncbi:hypothetical protein DPMN_040537 [Dreissena polymorpha]|uniref:Mab-21-like HhH/H2TH-like domain-containing protein n=2 Tax=Dreissena polymorpha TaxID=45954 RepID=A0A9D4CX40_DREPO|nr:hypothetical protein DPMN_040537 [Dreissena polymorpha]
MTDGGTDSSLSATGMSPIHSSLYSQHDQNYVEGVSVEVCHIMTLLGYGEEIRRRRIEKFRECDMLWNAESINRHLITVGSKAEGLTSLRESDYDQLHVLNKVLCVETGVDINIIPDDIEVCRMDTRDVYPGHCKMLPLPERLNYTRTNVFNNVVCRDEQGNNMISSGLFLDKMSKFRGEGVGPLKRAGPSLPRWDDKGLKFDQVFAVNCLCPSILQRWAQRVRLWPPAEVVQKVVSLGSVVTPVGFKGSKNNEFEWRICFNMGETELVHNLNITQAKVYVILKMIVKEVLKPNNKEITTFVMKNIILWQAERNPPSLFQEKKNLIYWLHDALGKLLTAISSTQLSYYMIPERNLMEACGLQAEQKRKWVEDITNMMEEGPSVILRLPRIRQAVICYPQPMLWFSRRRMEAEILILEWMRRDLQCRCENGRYDIDDIILVEIDRRQDEIAKEVYDRMSVEGSAVNNVTDVYFRLLM